MSCDQLLKPDAAAVSVAATSVRSDQKSDGWSPPQVIADRLLAGPARAPEQHALAGMHLVERALHRAAVLQPVPPRGLRAGRAVGEARVVGDVPALAVVGLDALRRPARSTRLACSRHHASAAGVGEVDRRAGAHPPACATSGSPSPSRTNISRLVVGRGRAVQPRGLGVRRVLAVVGVEVHPRRDPHDGPHAVRAPARRSSPRASGNWCGLNSHVLYCVAHGRVEHDRVEREAVLAVAVEVGLGVASGGRRRRGSSSARRPTPGSTGGKPGQPQERAQPGERASRA